MRGLKVCRVGITAQGIVDLIGFVQRQEISNLSAKSVLTEMLDSKKSAAQIIKDKNLLQISDTASLEVMINEVLADNAKSVADFKSGKTSALMFLVGQVMKRSQGKANPKLLQEMIKGRLS